MILEGKTAIITGGSRGIGKAIALEMARNGANIALIYAGASDKAKEVCNQIETYSRKAKAYCCDISSFSKTKEIISEIHNEFCSVDILVNNAGITADGLILQMSEEDFDKVIQVNLKGAFNMIKHTYRIFMKQKKGRIINISSVSGIMGNFGQANYAASKAGLIALTKTTARELAQRGITCNAIAPGFIETDMTAQMPKETLDNMITQIPLKRIGNPYDIASLAVFLASESASYITGEVIKVDGGLYI